MKKHGKKYLEISKSIDSKKSYSLLEAINILKSFTIGKFNESIDISIRVQTKKSIMLGKEPFVLPYSNNKKKKILVIIKDKQSLDYNIENDVIIEDEDIISQIALKKIKLKFTHILTTPQTMPKLAKVAKVLAPKGLLPSLKLGTVANNISSIITKIKSGLILIKPDKNGNINLSVGRKNFDYETIKTNVKAVYSKILSLKHKDIKGNYIKNISISTTMSPGIKINSNNLD